MTLLDNILSYFKAGIIADLQSSWKYICIEYIKLYMLKLGSKKLLLLSGYEFGMWFVCMHMYKLGLGDNDSFYCIVRIMDIDV